MSSVQYDVRKVCGRPVAVPRSGSIPYSVLDDVTIRALVLATCAIARRGSAGDRVCLAINLFRSFCIVPFDIAVCGQTDPPTDDVRDPADSPSAIMHFTIAPSYQSGTTSSNPACSSSESVCAVPSDAVPKESPIFAAVCTGMGTREGTGWLPTHPGGGFSLTGIDAVPPR